MAGIERDRLIQFWEKLPNLSPLAPQLAISGNGQIKDAQVFLPETAGERNESNPGQLRVFWLSGRFDKEGEIQLDVSLPTASMSPWDMVGRNKITTVRVAAQAKLKSGNKQHRFVGSLYARQRVDQLNAQIARLNEGGLRGRSTRLSNEKRAEREARLDSLRREVIRLSRTFSFISSETAFIALPEELQRKYGLTPQEYAAQQVYNFGRKPSSITPEPEATALFLFAAAVLRFIHRMRRRMAAPA